MRYTGIRKQSVKRIIITYNVNESSASKHTSNLVTVLLVVQLFETQSLCISKFHAPLHSDSYSAEFRCYSRQNHFDWYSDRFDCIKYGHFKSSADKLHVAKL